MARKLVPQDGFYGGAGVKLGRIRELRQAGIKKAYRLFRDMLYGMTQKSAAKGKKLRSAAYQSLRIVFRSGPSLCIRRAAGCRGPFRYAASDHRGALFQGGFAEPAPRGVFARRCHCWNTGRWARLDLLAVLGGSLIIACAAILSAILAFVVIWHSGRKAPGRPLRGLFSRQCCWLIRPISRNRPCGCRVFRIFRLILPIRPLFPLARGSGRPRRHHAASIVIARRKAQLKAYPQIQPILLDLDAPEAFDARGESGDGNRLEDRRTEAAGSRSGLAISTRSLTSFILGFPSDITLRLRPLAGQTRIDIRSASRFAPLDSAPIRAISPISRQP